MSAVSAKKPNLDDYDNMEWRGGTDSRPDMDTDSHPHNDVGVGTLYDKMLRGFHKINQGQN